MRQPGARQMQMDRIRMIDRRQQPSLTRGALEVYDAVSVSRQYSVAQRNAIFDGSCRELMDGSRRGQATCLPDILK
jgi:hypothetical protein